MKPPPAKAKYIHLHLLFADVHCLPSCVGSRSQVRGVAVTANNLLALGGMVARVAVILVRQWDLSGHE